MAFVAFRDECIWLRTCYDTFHALFGGNEETERVLKRTAQMFFTDLNVMMVEYWFIVASRITDPSRTMGRANLSVRNLLEVLREHDACTLEIEAMATALQDYRNLIQEARNRLVAHADRAAFLSKALLGEHQEAALLKFLRDLQSFNDLLGEAVGEGPLDFSVTSGPGDAYDLIRVLKSAA